MSLWQHTGRAAAAGALGSAAVILLATPASAKGGGGSGSSKRAICTAAVSAYKDAVEQSKAGHLRDARASLATCMQATVCGGLVPKCKAFSDKLAEKMSSVIPVVVDQSGAPLLDVQVKLDDQLVTSHLDGMAVLVDPGPHEFAFANDKGVFATQKVLVLEGQRDRAVTVTIAGQSVPAVVTLGGASPAPATPEARTAPVAKQGSESGDEHSAGKEPSEPTQSGSAHGTGREWAMPRSPVPYIVGGVGVVGLVAGGVLTAWGNSDTTQLENTCKPNCSATSNDHVKALYVAADVSFGVGAAALAVTTFLVATSHKSEGDDNKPARTGVLVDVAPTRSGAMATVSGSF